MVTMTKNDLEFILEQIRIAEAHAAAVAGVQGGDSVDQIGDALRDLVDHPLLPHGLRTVDGSYNNLVPGREVWGKAGEAFPQLTQPNWVNEDDDVISFGGGALQLTDGNYNEHGAPTDIYGITGGTLVDADPRTISNLIVDQTLDNPAAIAAALRYAGHAEADIASATVLIYDAHQAQPDVLDALAAAEAVVVAADAAVAVALQAIVDAAPSDIMATVAAWQAAQVVAADAAAARDAALADTQALSALLGEWGVELDGNTVKLPNEAPDEGLSAPYNSWFTLFGQFFDHGLDLVKKGGNGTVYIPLQPDDPLYDPESPHTNFMALTRASIGEDAGNVTTPWVDQNQTYTSHASHQVFLREYALDDSGKPVSTGLLLEGANGGLATWGEIKAQAREMLGIELTDADVGMVPLLRTDPYGNFIPDPATGYAQVIVGIGADGIPNTADDEVISGTPDAPASLDGAVRTPNAFLDDIAHAAVPVTNTAGELQADGDSAVGYSGGFNTRGQQTQYDNELLDAHYITGDGRGNENIGLTAVHFVFHAEHNRQIELTKDTAIASGDLAFLNEWLSVDIDQAAFATILAGYETAADKAQFVHDLDLAWDGGRLFQAARFSTEMQYQHLVFEEFARKVQPDVDLFIIQPDVEINPAIFAEFANVVYRFGHSMLNQTVDRTYADGSEGDIDLFQAFLNPLQFGEQGISQAEMAGAIALGMSAQRGNEIDEFVTDVLRNQLVGIPLDLAAINIARGRDTGMPTLNQARAQFQEMANGDTLLRPYENWADFAENLRNPESIINFIAAYGRHATIEGETTIEGKRDAAMELVFGVDVDGDGVVAGDRLDFLNATGAYAGGTLGGLNEVDLWMGGLAEKKMAFGGILGSTFSFVFQMQMENLQDSDRFYYLSRAQGLNLLTELENNSLAKMVMRNTNLEELGLAVPADIFSTPNYIFYVDYDKQIQMTGIDDPVHENPVMEAISALVQRGENYIRYNGLDHITIQGTEEDDHIIAGGGDDTVWGAGGNDRIEAGYGVDSINGGAGDDIITSAGTDIGAVTVMKGESGNDVIVDGTGLSLIFGGSGKDYLVSGFDDGEIRAGLGDDFLFGGDGAGILFGNEGDDWIEGGGGFDYIAGDNGELFFNSTIIGHDVLDGGSGDTDYDADSGDDIMFGGEGIQKNIGMWGHDWVIHKNQSTAANADMNFPVFASLEEEVLRDRFSQVEGLSGWTGDDVLRGDDRTNDEEEADGAAAPAPDPTPEGNFQYNELDQAGIDRIAGLDQIVTADLMREGIYYADGGETTKMVFDAGNILLGGGGSDLFEGRGGNDVIDGDAWLNVYISIRNAEGDEIGTADSMSGRVSGGEFDGRSLTSLMTAGAINPGQLNIVRQIEWDDSGEDTAFYWDVRENYEIVRNTDGSLTVTHVDQTTGATDPLTNARRTSDGSDRLYNIELLRFGETTMTVAQALNEAAEGAPAISDLTPTEGQTLSLDVSSIADANGLGAFAYQWQSSADGETWSDIAGATGNTLAVTDAGGMNAGPLAGLQLRAVVSFTDAGGSPETLISQATAPVGVNLSGNAQPNALTGTAGDDVIAGAGGDDVLSGLGGNDTLNGGAAADTLDGGEGNDTLNGGAGADQLIGGAGDDVVNGDGGNDTIVWNAGDGRDLVDGGDNGGPGDTFVVNGDDSGEAFAVYARAAAVSAGFTGLAAQTEIVIVRNGSVIAELTNIEEIVVNSAGGADTISVGGDFSPTSLSFSTITVLGSEDDDTIDLAGLQSAHRVLFRSKGGNDVIVGQMRDQDRVELAEGKTLADYTRTDNADGSVTLTTDGHSVTFFGTLANTQLASGEPHDWDDDDDHHDHDDDHDHDNDDDDHDDDDDDAAPAPPPPSNDDELTGTAGRDTLNGGSGDDLLKGKGGDDALSGGSGDDGLDGGKGDDTLSGGSGDDLLAGGEGDDSLSGGSGDDRLDGGEGDDLLTGGSGDDVFVFSGGDDRVTDFMLGQDTIDLSGLGVTAQTFASRVVISQSGSDTLVRIDGDEMWLEGVSANQVQSASFMFAAGAGGEAPPVDTTPETPPPSGSISAGGVGGRQLGPIVAVNDLSDRYQLVEIKDVRFYNKAPLPDGTGIAHTDWDFI